MNPEKTVISDTDFELTKLPLLQATFLPPYCYTSREFYELEVEQIFLKEWLCVGRVEQAEKPGDYFALEIANEPVVVARDEAGELHAMSAVCRHRAQVVAEGEGNVRSFQCPYHGWTYSLKGELIATPEMKQTENFDRTQICLPAIKLEVWEGFVFINFDSQCKPLAPALEGLSRRVANWKISDMRCPKVLRYDVACNWKNFVDISMEAYHSPNVHPDSLEADRPMHLWDTPEVDGAYEILIGDHVQQTSRTLGGDAALPQIESLSQQDLDESPLALVYPNLVLVLSADAIGYLSFLPKGPEQCTSTVGSCFPNSSVERSDFEEGASAHYAWWDALNPQDIRAVESSQRGVRSRFYRSGRYSIREKVPHRFHNYVIDRVL